MESYQFWKDEGSSFGLTGSSLQAFIEDKIMNAEERENRLFERNQQKISSEVEERRKQREHEIKQREHEIKQQELQIQERDKQRAHEIAMQKLKKDTPNMEPVAIAVDTTRPLPFRDGEDITAYLIRFEKVAQSLSWEKDTWPVKLASLLQGKALTIYTSTEKLTR